MSTATPATMRLQGALSNRVDSTKQIVSGDPSASASKLSDDGGNDVPPPVEVTPADDSDDVVRWSWRRFLLFCGPGLLMSVAYLVSCSKHQALLARQLQLTAAQLTNSTLT